GTLYTMTYYGSQMVVEHYNIMGPVKAALESTTRYLAAELGPKGIRVHAISPGPREAPRRPRTPGLRRAAAQAAIQSAEPQPRLDRRCRHCRRLPRHARSPADHRRDAVHRRRLPHHRLTFLTRLYLQSSRRRMKTISVENAVAMIP